MLPSSSRVKLNRVALKDVNGVKVSRRRRNVTAESQNQEEHHPVCGPVSASVPSSHEPVLTHLTQQMGPENVTDATANTPEDIDRNIHRSPTALAGSEGSLRRAVRASGCGLCGDCKYVSSQWKTSGKQGQKNGSPGPEQPTVEVKLKEENTVTENSKKIIVWIDQYPKVTLCDIAQQCDAFSHNCGYVLPDVLKTKVVHCFKQDMRAGFQFRPGLLGQNKHESEQGALAKNGEFCPRLQSQSPTEHQRHLKESTDARTVSSRTTCHFLKSWTSEGSATCCASFVLGKSTKKGKCRTGMLSRDVEEDSGPGAHLMGEGNPTDKIIELGDSVKDGFSPSTPDSLKSISCKNSTETDSRDKEKTCFWMSDSQPCSEEAAGGNTSAVKKDGVYKKSWGELHSVTETDAAHMSSELLCERNEVEVDTDEPDSFTCQRVRTYFRKNAFSCARTYMSWPFSNSGWALTARSGTTASPAEAVDPSTRDNRSVNNEEKREEDGESILAERNGKRHGNISSHSSDSKNMGFSCHLMDADEPLAAPTSDTATLSNPSQRGREPVTDAAESSRSTPSPSALGLSDWEATTTLSSMSSPFTPGLSSLSATPSSLPPSSFLLRKVKSVELAGGSPSSCMVGAVEKALFHCEETRMASCSPSSSAPPHSSESSLLLPQDEQVSDEERLAGRCPPKLEPYYNTSPINHDLVKERSLHNVLTDECVETDSSEFMLPPMLSPVTTPQRRSLTSFLPQSPGCVDEEEDETVTTSKHKMIPGCHMTHIVNGNNENSKDYLEHGNKELEDSTNFKTLSSLRVPQSSPSNDEDVDSNEEESQDDYEDAVEQGSQTDPKIKATLTSGALTKSCSALSSNEGDEGSPHSTREEGSSPCELLSSEGDETKAEAADDAQQGILDEYTAYEHDILLVDVIQDDPELFENLPQQSLLKLGPTRVTEAPKTIPIGVGKTLSLRIDGTSQESAQRSSPVIYFQCNSPDITEERNDRPWRPHCSRTPSKMQRNTWTFTEKQTKSMGQPDANNNHINGGLERSQPIQTVNSLHNHIPPLMTIKNGPRITNPANLAEFRRQKFSAYCRQYFSESLSCGFKICRFQHVPVEGDEKFCIETVTRFIKNPMCLQKAGAVFTGYYTSNPPGVYFSMPVLLSLLWALLKAGMVSDVFSVLSVSLAHKIVPGHEFVLALFNLVREKSLVGFVPELMQLTSKMASAGLVLSLDCLDCVKNTPEFQQTASPNSHVSASGNQKLSTTAPFPEYLNLAHAVVEIELCTKQEDWRRMGEVFRSICQSSQRPNQVERISGRIAIALLSESKDKLSLPFAAFAETVCQNEGDNSLIRSFLGRIGVSLMFRYHKTHQWAKGRRVVEVLSILKVNYSTLKGLFGNEDGASRCYLVTVATELFLLSGSVEGALNTLRENKWFLNSSLWPCEPADLESRARVLIRLAEKTSHRDTLDVLRNLPGLKEPNDLVSISRYHLLFNSHLQVCVDRQTLPVASDTVDFMLSKNLAVDHTVLQILLHKLGKQNLWLRAREVFRHSLSVGYYPGVSAPPGLMSLTVPCRLREVELALAFEMFITVNATAILQLSETASCCLSIILQRTQSCESEYLSAGSRLLSAACIPQPKLIIHYKAVNSSQEQVFTLDISSARCWLRHNHLWANEVWTH
ncbi:uncharacterized protein topaz1 isoform X2 [Dicentrarchus labrax]|uniref:uncharacterized protein topaz1 isoform X2 n=1 Tax=Dicentrarchus labrax TaxID=13489 RepID=UPI0021F68EBA|nr:uncharacterized protein topaz1 isoform X2 [Dicentrarchus labrax]